MVGKKGKIKLVTLLLTAGIIVGGFLTTCDNALYDGAKSTKTGGVQDFPWEPVQIIVLKTTNVPTQTGTVSFMPKGATPAAFGSAEGVTYYLNSL
jgi:hypothetical protein